MPREKSGVLSGGGGSSNLGLEMKFLQDLRIFEFG